MKTLLSILLFTFGAVPSVLFASPETDRKIETAAMASYNYHAVLQDRVTVTAHEGEVTLSGVVEDQGEKDLAADTIANYPGVKKVVNSLTIESSYPEHSDAWMAFKIRSLLLVKAKVSVANTKVEVKDGVVTLSGSAANQAQKDLTGLYAKEIDGVKSVKNNLVVSASSGSGEDKADELIDDASITAQVKRALSSHESTRDLEVSISTNEGVVKLGGVAATGAEKSLAGKLAKDVRGVKSVTNAMTVKS